MCYCAQFSFTCLHLYPLDPVLVWHIFLTHDMKKWSNIRGLKFIFRLIFDPHVLFGGRQTMHLLYSNNLLSFACIFFLQSNGTLYMHNSILVYACHWPAEVFFLDKSSRSNLLRHHLHTYRNKAQNLPLQKEYGPNYPTETFILFWCIFTEQLEANGNYSKSLNVVFTTAVEVSWRRKKYVSLSKKKKLKQSKKLFVTFEALCVRLVNWMCERQRKYVSLSKQKKIINRRTFL